MSATARKAAALIGEHPPVVVGVVEQPVLRITAVDGKDPPHLAAGDAVAGFQVERIEPNVVAHAGRQPLALGQFDQLARLLRGHGQRLFADHVLAGGDDPLGEFVVQHVGHGQVDRLHARRRPAPRRGSS